MILATNNKNKIREIKEILSNYEIQSLAEVNVTVDVLEDQNTFFGNASKKAKEIYEITKQPVIADDSGLCIKCFNDWPGVMTHRFLGDNATDRDRNLAIIEKMKDLHGDDRKASVICSLVFYDGVNMIEGKGILNGSIVIAPRGENGFGFDEIFEINDEIYNDSNVLNGKTLAELTAEEKNKVSARYLAAIDLKEKLSPIEGLK